MTITIHLPLEAERRLSERAAKAGLSVEQYVLRLVEQESANGTGDAPKQVSNLEAMTGPIARAAEATGMTEEELVDFVKESVKEVRAEKRAKLERR